MWRVDDGIPIVNMVRFYLAVTPHFELYLHQFTDDDEPVLHDHPWSFISFLLAGRYIEHFADNASILRTRWSVSLRRAGRKHHVAVPELYRGKTISLLIAGRRHRAWHFWDHEMRCLTPYEYGSKRGATLNTFSDLTIVGKLLPKVIGGTDTPSITTRSL